MKLKQRIKNWWPFRETYDIKVTKHIHAGWREFEMAKSKLPGMKQMFGKYQHIYSSPKGRISMVYFPDYFGDGKSFYEIFCLEGNLFDDVERFTIKQDAIWHAQHLLR